MLFDTETNYFEPAFSMFFSWREGVIIEKNKKDETTLSVHFPGISGCTPQNFCVS